MNDVDILTKARDLVTKQAEDEGLWVESAYIAENYLQEQLRLLHAVIEDKTPIECVAEVLSE